MKRFKEGLKIMIISIALLIGISTTTFATTTVAQTTRDGIMVASGMSDILDAAKAFRNNAR